MAMALTDKQQRFVEEYLIDLNATQAAIRAGYEWPKTRKGFYVYFLIDPRNDNIFYVGKGVKNRIKGHVKAALAGLHSNGVKDATIREIVAYGCNVREVVFADGMDECASLRVEKYLIGSIKNFGLANISGGMVSSLDSMMSRIDKNISATKPYEEWIQNLPPTLSETIDKVWGSPKSCYDWYSSQRVKLRQKTLENPKGIYTNG